MAVKKAKPKKAKPATKSKVVKARPVAVALKEYHQIIDSRYEIAKRIYDYQDSLTKEVIERIVMNYRVASPKVVNINNVPHALDFDYVKKNALFAATEILGDLALNGIQVANFKFHPEYCADCKIVIKRKK